MTLFDRVKYLAEKQKISISRLEEDLGLGKNYLYKWKKNSPNSDTLQKVADYFNVSTDYLLGRSDTLTEKAFRPKVQKIARNASHLSDKDLDKLNDVMSAIFKDKFND